MHHFLFNKQHKKDIQKAFKFGFNEGAKSVYDSFCKLSGLEHMMFDPPQKHQDNSKVVNLDDFR